MTKWSQNREANIHWTNLFYTFTASQVLHTYIYFSIHNVKKTMSVVPNFDIESNAFIPFRSNLN